ncbi:MAG: metalloprotease PmbA [Gammaproteobacteria bacterium]|nr:metalloprotease PmbA [Gammaproteobacteria bacterium]
MQDKINSVLKLAKNKGASQAEVLISNSTGLAVQVHKQQVETIEFDRSKGIGLTVYFGKKKGSASTSDFSEESIKETVEKACSLTNLMEEDEFCGLADSELMAYNKDNSDLDLFHPWHLDPEEAKVLALECEAYGLNYSPKITNSDGTSVHTSSSHSIYTNSHGFIGEYESAKHSISCSLIAEHKQKMQREHWYTISRLASNLDNLKIIGETAAKRTLARLDPRSVKTQKAKILFSPEMARGLFGSFISAISGGSLYREATFLLNKLDQQVFSNLVNITDDPFIKQGFGSSYFDSEGVKTQKRQLVDKGILNGYILSSYSARRLGMQSTGNSGGVHNLLIAPSMTNMTNTTNNQQELIKSMSTGFLVTELMGQGINIVTGDYSRGASGFWVENGEIAYPVEGVTIAGNLKDMFLNIIAIGADIDTRSSIQTGSVLIEEMMIAGG